MCFAVTCPDRGFSRAINPGFQDFLRDLWSWDYVQFAFPSIGQCLAELRLGRFQPESYLIHVTKATIPILTSTGIRTTLVDGYLGIRHWNNVLMTMALVL